MSFIGVVSEGEKQGWGIAYPRKLGNHHSTIARLDAYITNIAVKIWVLL